MAIEEDGQDLEWERSPADGMPRHSGVDGSAQGYEHPPAALPGSVYPSEAACAMSHGASCTGTKETASETSADGHSRPKFQDWELINLSQASLSQSAAGMDFPVPTSSTSAASSVISMGGMEGNFLHSAHFSPLHSQTQPPVCLPPSTYPHTAEGGQRSSILAVETTPINFHQAGSPSQEPPMPSTGASGPRMVLWQQEVPAPASSPTLLTFSAAGLLSGLPAASSLAQLQGASQQPSHGQMWSLPPSVVEALPLEEATPLGISLVTSQGSSLASSWTTNLPGDSVLSTGHHNAEIQSFTLGSQQGFSPYLGEAFGSDSWQVTLPRDAVPLSGTVTSAGLPLPAPSLPVVVTSRGAGFTGGATGGEDESSGKVEPRPDETPICAGAQAAAASPSSRDRCFAELDPQEEVARDEEDFMDDVLSSFESDQESLSSDSGEERGRTSNGSSRHASWSSHGEAAIQVVAGEGLRPVDAPAASQLRTRDSRARGARPGNTAGSSGRRGWMSAAGGQGPLVRRIWAVMEEHQSALWATAVAAAVVGIVLLAQRWQLERRRSEHLRRLVSKKDEKIGEMRVQLLRLQEALSRRHHVPVLRTSASFPTLSSCFRQL